MWFIFALLSAVFAALTSILAKVGIDGVNSNPDKMRNSQLFRLISAMPTWVLVRNTPREVHAQVRHWVPPDWRRHAGHKMNHMSIAPMQILPIV